MTVQAPQMFSRIGSVAFPPKVYAPAPVAMLEPAFNEKTRLVALDTLDVFSQERLSVLIDEKVKENDSFLLAAAVDARGGVLFAEACAFIRSLDAKRHISPLTLQKIIDYRLYRSKIKVNNEGIPRLSFKLLCDKNEFLNSKLMQHRVAAQDPYSSMRIESLMFVCAASKNKQEKEIPRLDNVRLPAKYHRYIERAALCGHEMSIHMVSGALLSKYWGNYLLNPKPKCLLTAFTFAMYGLGKVVNEELMYSLENDVPLPTLESAARIFKKTLAILTNPQHADYSRIIQNLMQVTRCLVAPFRKITSERLEKIIEIFIPTLQGMFDMKHSDAIGISANKESIVASRLEGQQKALGNPVTDFINVNRDQITTERTDLIDAEICEIDDQSELLLFKQIANDLKILQQVS